MPLRRNRQAPRCATGHHPGMSPKAPARRARGAPGASHRQRLPPPGL